MWLSLIVGINIVNSAPFTGDNTLMIATQSVKATDLNYFILLAPVFTQLQPVCKELLSKNSKRYCILYIVIGRALKVIQGCVNRGPIIIWKS